MVKFKNYCYLKLNEWQSLGQQAQDSNGLDLVLKDAENLMLNLKEKNIFLTNNYLNHKLVYNQKYEIKSLLESFLGRIELNPDYEFGLNSPIKYLNELVHMETVNMDPGMNYVLVLPLLFKKFLFISKKSFDEYSDVSIQVQDSFGKVLHENNDLIKVKVNCAQSFSNFLVISLTEYKTGRNVLKLYDLDLSLIKSSVLDNQCNMISINSTNIYVKIESTYPFLFKYDYELNKQDLFDKILSSNLSGDLFVSLAVDKLACVSSGRIYLIDSCFWKIKIYSETSGELIDTICIKSIRDCAVFVTSQTENEEVLEERIICLNKQDKVLNLFDKYGKILEQNKLDEGIRNINEFYVCQDGSYVFVDNLNDRIYCYFY